MPDANGVLTPEEWAAQKRAADEELGRQIDAQNAANANNGMAGIGGTTYGDFRHAQGNEKARQQQIANSYLGQYDATLNGPATLDQQVYSDARALGDSTSNQSKAYGWQGPSMASREKLAADAAARGPIQADFGQADQDFARALQARGDQAHGVDLYRNAAEGKGPSAAQAQFQSNLDAALRNTASTAAGARGGSMARGAAMRQALQQQGDMTLQAGAQSAQLRATEMQNAMAGYTGASGQLRAGDVGAAGQHAGMATNQAQLGLQSRGQNDQASQFYQGQAMDAGKAATDLSVARERDRRAANQSAAQLNLGIYENDKAGIAKVGNAIMGGVTGVAGGAMSDERAKRDVHSGDAKAEDFLDAIKAYDYRYKPESGADDGQRHVSAMAQDLEKTQAGRAMVHDTPRGKVVDYTEGFATMLAAQGNLNARMREIEAALAAKHGGR